MIDRPKRAWWPFDVITEGNQNAEHRAGINFLTYATDMGYRAYMEGSDFGAVSDADKECRIVWRGRQRRELLLIAKERCIRKEVFVAAEEGAALAEAGTVGLEYLKSGFEDPTSAGTLNQPPVVGGLASKPTPIR